MCAVSAQLRPVPSPHDHPAGEWPYRRRWWRPCWSARWLATRGWPLIMAPLFATIGSVFVAAGDDVAGILPAGTSALFVLGALMLLGLALWPEPVALRAAAAGTCAFATVTRAFNVGFDDEIVTARRVLGLTTWLGLTITLTLLVGFTGHYAKRRRPVR